MRGPHATDSLSSALWGRIRNRGFVAAVLATVLSLAPVHGEGTETLGPPGITLAPGTRIVGGGTGLFVQPGSISVDVPAGATVRQVLLYWNGFDPAMVGTPGNSLLVNGSTTVVGSLIGGPTLFFSGAHSYSYRADITALGLIAAGSNSVTVAGASFATANNGASVVVVIDEGGTASSIEVRDGQDLAFETFAPPLDTTVPQNLKLLPVASARSGELTILAGSVDPAGVHRPSIIRVISGGITTDFNDLLTSFDGRQWDHLTIPVTIPAGADQLSVQILSADCCATGNPPASLVWVGAGLVVFPATGDVAGRVFLDLDGDGSFDNDESGITGVGIELRCPGLDGIFDTPDDFTSLALSDALGQYSFSGVPAGPCSVSLDTTSLPLGTEVGACPLSAAIDVPRGASIQVQDLCLRPDTPSGTIADRLWLPLPDSDEVVVLNPDGLAVGMLDTAMQSMPVAVAVGPTGVVWVVFEATDSLVRYSNLGTLVDVLAVGDDPQIIVVDAGGSAWVANGTPRTLTRVRADGVVLLGVGGTQGGALPTEGEPRGLAVDALGNLYVVTATPGRLEKRDESGGVITSVTLPDGADPTEIAVDRAGFVWTVLRGLNSVQRRASDLSLIETFDLPAGSLPSRLAIRGATEAWVLAAGTGAVHRLLAGGQLSTFALGGTLSGIAIDGRGNVWVGDASAGTSRRLDPNGQLQQTVVLPSAARFRGDATGITLANVLLPGLDFDADGASNSLEIDQLSSPFDASNDPSQQPDFVAPLLELTCTAVIFDVTLTWQLPGTAVDTIEVRRNGILQATLPGTAMQYSEPAGLPEGVYEYDVRGSSGASTAQPAVCSVVIGGGQLQNVFALEVGDVVVNVFDITTRVGAGSGDPAYYLTDPANGKVYGTDANFMVLVVIDSPLQGLAPTTGIAFNPDGNGGLGSLLLGAGSNGDPQQIATVVEIALDGTPLGPPIQLFRTAGGGGVRLGVPRTAIRGGVTTLSYKRSSDVYMATGTQNCELFAFRTSGGFGGGLTTGKTGFESVEVLPNASAQHPLTGYALNGVYLTDFAGFDENGGRVWVTSPSPNGGFELTVIAIAGGVAQVVGPAIPLSGVSGENAFGGFTLRADSLAVIGLTTSQVYQLGSAFFGRGDTDGNQVYDVGDAIRLLSALFEGFPFRSCVDAYDFDDNGSVNLSDGVGLLGFMFAGGPAPGSPILPSRGPDPTPDTVPCL